MSAHKRADKLSIPPSTTEHVIRQGGTVVFSQAQASNLLRRAALKPKGFQFIQASTPGGRVDILILKNAPGGRLLIQPTDAGSFLACCLGVALERMACLHKLGIAEMPFGIVPIWVGSSLIPEYLPTLGGQT